MRAPVVCEPLVALAPAHAPDATQEVALLDDQLKVEAPPLATVLGVAARWTTGAGEVTDTVTD